jgi:hypothetical protein
MIDSDDRYDQLCTKCGMGRYHETSIHDDWEGVLHCTNKKCNHEVKRYKSDDNPQPTQQMKLNKAQFEQFVDNYAQHIIEGLDNHSMEVMLFDLLTSQYGSYTQEFIVREIEELYGEEVAADLLESASDVPVAELSTI